MKKIYGFLTAAAILLTAACTQDLEGPNKVDEVKGDFYMTMNITPVGNAATRATTQTPNQGKEVGQDNENNISDALVIFAKPKAADEADQFVVFAVLGGTNNAPTMSSGNRIDGMTSYSATFKTERSVLLEDVQRNGTETAGSGSEKAIKYRMFVIANPQQTLKEAYSEAAGSDVDVQSVFSVSGLSDATYWGNSGFLMSNAMLSDEVTIKESDVAMGTHTSPAEALSLGSVTVQRAMSRFDIATGSESLGNQYRKFTITNDKSPIKALSIEMKGVALVNMAKSANVFKVTADNYAAINNNGKKKTLAFDVEKYTMARPNEQPPVREGGNWVFSPVQKNVSGNYDFISPIFTNIVEGGSEATEGTIGKLTGTAQNLETNFTYTSWESLMTGIGLDRDTFTPPTDAVTTPNTYKFWRYCMENTNPDQIANQKNGVSTGVIFKAEITVVANESDASSKFGNNKNLYALGNVFFGNLEHLRDYVYKAIDEDGKNIHTDDADVYATVSNKFKDAVKAYNESEEGRDTPFYEDKKMEKNDGGKYEEKPAENTTGKEGAIGIWSATEEQLQVLNKYLVNNSADNKGQGFSIYEPDSNGKYYCYYIYWNRHNNNYDDTQMGIMEFATVRNNVYKLSVGAVLRLGHPANPDNDPKKPDPDDPDEEDEFYCTIDCKVLDWEVRVNDIIF